MNGVASPGPRLEACQLPSRLMGSRPQIQAVTFDVGGTLIEVWPSVGHVYAEVAARHGINGLAAGALNRRFVAAWRSAKQFRHSRSDWARLVDATFRGLTDQPPSRTFFGELYARFADADAWRVFEDVVPTLESSGVAGPQAGGHFELGRAPAPTPEATEAGRLLRGNRCLARSGCRQALARDIRARCPAAGAAARGHSACRRRLGHGCPGRAGCRPVGVAA